MRKVGARPHLKRVSAASKERRCGVPCTLLVAAWTLFILLLLTSSISHEDNEHAQRGFSHTERPWTAIFFWSSRASSSIHALFGREDGLLQGHHEHYFLSEWVDFRIGKKLMERGKADKSIFPRFAVLEESDFATQQELTGVGQLVGRGADLPYGDGPEDFVGSSVVSSSSDETDGHLSQFTKNSNSVEQQPTSFSEAVSHPTIMSQELGAPIDALQYAEYGAGLLQKSGSVEEKSKICLLRNATGTSCRVISHHGEFPGQNCMLRLASQSPNGQDGLPCWNEALAEEQELCHDASSYGGDLVAEIGPGGDSYLVCQMDPLTSSTPLCGVACSTQSECLSPIVDSDSKDGSNGGRPILETPTAVTSMTADLVSNELHSSGPCEGLHISSDVTAPQYDEELSPPIDLAADLNSIGQQGVDEARGKPEASGDEIPKRISSDDEIDGDELKAVEYVIEEGIDPTEFLTAVVESEATGRESLVYPTENGTTDERDFEDELLEPLPAENELIIEEPRRLKRVGSVMSLDEYKRSILDSQRKSGNEVNLSSVQVQQKVRHSDETYNYASATHGAKVLASNKEAKGASHILTSDKDKYLRNPCGAEDKFVVVELSEETFVESLFISNFEFHSSNLKDFELLGSPVYPTKDWISLGKFQAENVRQRQKFSVEDPKLVRHLMIKMLNHWGSEFFCTLSIVEVFGVDVMKNLLDDWIALEEGDSNPMTHGSNGLAASQEELSTSSGTGQQPLDGDAALDAAFMETWLKPSDMGTSSEHQGGVAGGRDNSLKTDDGGLHGDEDSKAASVGDASAQEVIHVQGGKTPGDSVLKILMQKVKALELNQTLFDLYLGDLNQKYKAMLSELDKDLALVTDRLRNQTALTSSLAMRLADRELRRKEEKLSMEHRFAQIASNFTDNLDFMRWQIQSMERREITAILLSFLCMIISALLNVLAACIPRRRPFQSTAAQTGSSEEVVDSKLGEMDCKIVGPDSKSSGVDNKPDSEIVGLDSKTTGVDSKLDSKIVGLDSKTTGVDSKLDCKIVGLDSKLSRVDSKLDSKIFGLDSKSSGIDSKLDSLRLSSVCQRSSSFILYLACGLTIIVLSV